MPYSHHQFSDTIIALATPQGTGAIGVIRLSGEDAITQVDRFFEGKDLKKIKGHTIHLGKIKDEEGRILDECLVSVFKGPRSYTREDVVEISCHGSNFIITQIVQLFIRFGVRQANRGEFTLRAFLNGQLDLTQAEAVADLIAAEGSASHDLAMRQMRGGFSDQIKHLRQELIDFASLIELELDFGEEDVEFADRGKLSHLVIEIQKVLKELIDSFQLGNVLKGGVSTVIAGRPNAGKSTLLNALLNDERAIVSEIAGTTRDTIEEVLTIKGVQFRLIDTAGIREAQDSIEQIGVERTLREIAQSTVVIYVFDVTSNQPRDLWDDVEEFLNKESAITAHSQKLFIANKMDLNPYTRPEDYYKNGMISADNLITVSAKNRMNIEYLKNRLFETVISFDHLSDQTIVTNSRHYDALYKSQEALDKVVNGLSSGLTGDFIALDIRQALHHLGEISGEIHTDDLLESIFGRFCIGK